VEVAVDVAHWLRNQGLGKYERAFRENAIDLDVLSDLTDEDLKQIGVALGDRKRLLKAIASFPPAGTTSLAEEGVPLARPAERAKPAPAASAERRQVTVVFCDLVGSTELSARMDPEDLREVISAYQKCVAGTVERLGGFLAKYMGDGVLIYFGYPQAHEDDAERAVRAGLEVIVAVSALETYARL
jgi:class 3 adenylate cyclase